jgi:hypothetical protein
MALRIRLRPTRLLSRLLAPGLLAVGLLAPLGAHAQPTPADAEGLEQQLRSWLADLLGPGVPLGERPFHITAEGDHFRVEVPIAGPIGTTGFSVEAAPFALAATPLEGGRWALDSIDNVTLLRLVRDDPAATGWRNLTWSAADMKCHADLDPSFATASAFDGSLHDYTTVEQGPDGAFTSRIGSVSSHEVWEPAGGGRLNVSDTANVEQIRIEGSLPGGGGPLTVTVDRATRTGRLQDLAPDHIGPAVRAGVDLLAPLLQAAVQETPATTDCSGDDCDKQPVVAKQGKATPEQRRAVRALAVALRDLLGGVSVQQSMENLHVVAGPHEATLARLAIGEDVIAADGKLNARLSLALDGLDSPEIPPGILRDYLPRHIALTPRISNVPSAAGIDLLLKAIDAGDENSPELEAEAKGLLRQSPLTLGLDDVALDLGPASLTASGEMQVPSAEPEEITGHADISVTGLDTLIKQSNANPQLRQAGPVLLMLKGIGEQDGKTVVWHVTYQDKQVMVNGNDLTQMMPAK